MTIFVQRLLLQIERSPINEAHTCFAIFLKFGKRNSLFHKDDIDIIMNDKIASL